LVLETLVGILKEYAKNIVDPTHHLIVHKLVIVHKPDVCNI
jgi:hypothetical protein